MKIFFDTEFTGLHQNTTLISIGLVDENNRFFYAEFTDYDKTQCDKWIEDNVISKLDYNEPTITMDRDGNIKMCGTTNVVRCYLLDWLNQYGEETIELVSDCCHYDMVLFINLFDDAWKLPKNIVPTCYDINNDIMRYYGISWWSAFNLDRLFIANVMEEDDKKHNSLYDAQIIKRIYYLLKNGFELIEKEKEDKYKAKLETLRDEVIDLRKEFEEWNHEQNFVNDL